MKITVYDAASLRAMMKTSNISSLARVTGLNAQTLLNFKNGSTKNPSFNMMLKLTKHFEAML